jgi:hypothetical protein
MRSSMRCGSCARCLALVCALAIALITAAGAAPAAPRPSTPQSRLFSVWLDMRLVAIFYPHTNAATLLPNLTKVALQLRQPLPTLLFGETARDIWASDEGAVMIKRDPPPNTWILFTRSKVQVWKLVDDAHGALTVSRVKVF